MGKWIISNTKEEAKKKVHTLIMGKGKVGKTGLTLTLPCPMNRILYIGADPGELRLRHVEIPTFKPANGIWNEEMMQDCYNYLLTERKKYDFSVIDGLDTLGNEVNAGHQEEYKDGRKAWEQTNNFMDQWIRRMRDINGVSSLWITHPAEVTDDMGRVTIKPSMPGNKLKNEINNYFDIIGYMTEVRGADGNLIPLIQFTRNPDERVQVGDRSGALSDYEAPNLAGIFKKIQESGMSVTDYTGNPTPGEMEALKQIIRLDKTKEAKRKVDEALAKNKLSSPAEMSREQFDSLMKNV